MSYASRRDVVLHVPYRLARTGQQLPAGSYVVSAEPRFISSQGQTSAHSTNYLEVPSGALGPDHAGGTILMTDDELQQAQSARA